MKRRDDIYKTKAKMTMKSFEKYREASIAQCNREVLDKWVIVLKAREVGEVRIAKLLMQMVQINKWLPKSYKLWDKFDVLVIAQKINDHPTWSRATKVDYRRFLRQFFRWYLFDSDIVETDCYKKLWKELCNLKIEFVIKKVDEHNILLENDLQVILDKGCNDARDRAFICVLHEAGLRIEEILNMRRSHVVTDDRFYKIKVTGKTGERTLTLVISAPYLRRYLLEHPLRNEPDYYIWVSLRKKHGEFNPLDYKGSVKLIKRAVKRAGIDKPANPHHFRHSRLTINGSFMTDSDLCSFAGWTKGSKCVQIYVHTTYNKVRDSILRMRGIEAPKEREQTTKTCSSCMSENLFQANYCAACGTAISTEGHVTLQKYQKMANDSIERIMQDPLLLEQFNKWRETKKTE